jgi:hypothetical protein
MTGFLSKTPNQFKIIVFKIFFAFYLFWDIIKNIRCKCFLFM